jgi:hypothetical protein
MFKIMQEEHAYDYCPKIHFASSLALANEVADDLEARFGHIVLEDVPSNECMWDPGGMMIADDKVFEFPLDDITILCKTQHFEYFVDRINKCAVRGEEIPYVKIHGAYNCICITAEEFALLKVMISNPSLHEQSERYWQDRENKLKKLDSLEKVAIDIDGNIYDLCLPQLDKKDLN